MTDELIFRHSHWAAWDVRDAADLPRRVKWFCVSTGHFRPSCQLLCMGLFSTFWVGGVQESCLRCSISSVTRRASNVAG